MIHDERGAATTETLIVFPVVLFFFLALFQLGYLCTAHLIVQRAASAAARAAMVYLADHPSYYPDPEARAGYVKEAARRVLMASEQFVPGGLSVTLSGERKLGSPMLATVQAKYDCAVFLVGLLCGADMQLTLKASCSLPYQ
jgi:Flp pilus assembly protein TadG